MTIEVCAKREQNHKGFVLKNCKWFYFTRTFSFSIACLVEMVPVRMYILLFIVSTGGGGARWCSG